MYSEEIIMSKKIDRIDKNILFELQKDGRLSNVELSKRVGLSPTPCLYPTEIKTLDLNAENYH